MRVVLRAWVDQGCRRHGCAFSAASVVAVWSCRIKVFTSSGGGRCDPANTGDEMLTPNARRCRNKALCRLTKEEETHLCLAAESPASIAGL